MHPGATLIAIALVAAGISSPAYAALQGRDLNGSADSFEAYYDTDLNITWLADANYAKTSGYDVYGRMTWADANTWVATLSFTDGIHVYDNWRLPTSDACFGNNCTGSEMGHLFYSELGGVAGQTISTVHNANYNLFSNLRDEYYWSGSELDPISAWHFEFNSGYQFVDSKEYGAPQYAFAVSPGDVSAVPEADTWVMLLAGLGLVGAVTRRRR